METDLRTYTHHKDEKRSPMINVLKKLISLFCTGFILFGSYPLLANPFDIQEFTDPYKYGWTDENDRLTARDNLFLNTMFLDEYSAKKQSPIINALKTSVAPGWGHFSVESYTKGQIFLGVQLALLGSGIYFREKAMIEYRKYEKATQIDDIDKYYDDTIIPHRQSSLLFTLSIVVWGYTIYDAIVETNHYNWELWEKLSTDKLSSNLSITPVSITWRF